MDGAASVIAVVSVALSSVRVIYETVSGIKNAPQTIQQMISNIHDLSNILQQLLGYGDNLHLATELPDLVHKCAENLGTLKRRLEKLSSSKNKRMGRLWKNVKATLQEKDLDRMSALLQQHVAILSLQINLLERKCLSSHTVSLERVEALSNKQVALNTTNSSTLESMRAGVDQIHDSVKNIRSTSQTSSQSTRQALEEMGDKIQNLDGLSSEQSATLNSILELLKQQFPTKSPNAAARSTSYQTMKTSDDMEMKDIEYNALDDDSLQDALNRLCRFAKVKERTIFSDEADSVIVDIEQMLTFLLRSEGGDQSTSNGSRKRKVPCESESDTDRNLQYQHEVKRFKGLLNSSHCIAINEKICRPWTAAPGRSKLYNTFHRQSSCNGNFVVQARHQVHNDATTQHKSVKNSQTSELRIIEGSITFVPNAPKAIQVAVHFQQRELYEGSFLRKPVLSFSALLPYDSKVFSLIENGDLNSLVKVFTMREACLTDRDLDGRSLLNYALRFRRPDICKFLIDEGADVDFLEPNIHGYTSNDHKADPGSLALTNQCRRLLFEAGADPTISANDDYSSSFYHEVLDAGATETLSLLLSHGRQFIEADSSIELDSLLSKFLSNEIWTSESIALILRMQKNSKLPSQSLYGCLHSAIKGSLCENEEGLKNVLILLIEAGADVYAKNSHGFSVSDLACATLKSRHHSNKKTVWKRSYDLQKQKSWAEALSACGYDAEEVMAEAINVHNYDAREIFPGYYFNELSDDSDVDIQTQPPSPFSNRFDCSAIEDLGDSTLSFKNETFDHMNQSEHNHDFQLPIPSSHNFQSLDSTNYIFQLSDSTDSDFHLPSPFSHPFQLPGSTPHHFQLPNDDSQPPDNTLQLPAFTLTQFTFSNNYDWSLFDEATNIWRSQP